ncbi:GMC family oxidoreductase [Flavobacterium ovatum]|uniref:GMC family oxidoreductase n=1 Tax=Flavobacterium ovatum TaxID=1928857 RepID=UPI00344F7B6A
MDNRIFDLCIIGSGPAGIITALEYSKLNPEKTILLVEYGKSDTVKNPLDDSIIISNLTNHHPVYECTNKKFGGSSETWGGRCVMYDEVDFIDRPIINNGCTWDLDLFEEVKKYLSQTAAYFECGEAKFNLNQIDKFEKTRIADDFDSENISDSVVERWSMPTRFGIRYRKEIFANKNITLIEGYEARSFEKPIADGKVSLLELVDWDNKVKQIEARDFVIAAGAQESTRLLLRNLQLFKNLNDVPHSLGKYYQGHLSGKIASVQFYGNPKKTDYAFLRDDDGIYLRRRFQFKADYLIENNLLNTAIWLDNPLYYDPKHGSGAMSFMYMAMITPFLGKKLAPPAIADSITKGKVENLDKHLLNIIKGFPFSISKPAIIFFKRFMLKRKLPGVFLYSPENKYALHFHSEQIPYEGNTITLSEDGDKLLINYTLTDDDINSVIALHKELDQSLQKSGCGKLEYWFPEADLFNEIKKMSRDGIHQSGTTRIANSAEKGVVDRNLKIFGTANIYVCSSSVFPTSGQANPTFFLGAFAVRLAHELTYKK